MGMDTVPNGDCFLFVIKTNAYAGNFEREICGYVTGEVGECDVGDNEADMFITDCPGNTDFEDMVIQFPDEHGCHRPVTICGPKCHNVVIFLETHPTDKQLVLMRDRARKFADMTNPHDNITILGFELHKFTITYDDRTEKTWGNNE